MIIEIARYTTIAFGLFFLFIGGLMLFKPTIVRATLRKAGSTNLINYGEITVRIIPAIALIVISEHSKYPEFFKVFGWFMLATSFILYFVPKKLHHDFSNNAADILKPLYFQLISPLSALIGVLIINAVL
jgi:uncharacterized membrane protein YfcA